MKIKSNNSYSKKLMSFIKNYPIGPYDLFSISTSHEEKLLKCWEIYIAQSLKINKESYEIRKCIIKKMIIRLVKLYKHLDYIEKEYFKGEEE